MKTPSIIFQDGCIRYLEPKVSQEMFVVLEMELQIYGHLLKMLLCNMTN